ncbi:MAG: class I SAM-dependent methyltransferase [bacterium]|nr:class I SAM-dependent methyltransferase [bacterium]
MRERAFFGMLRDECIPNKRGVDWALDIGCGAGWLLKRLAKAGWLIEGVEWNKEAAELAASRTGAKVFDGDVMSLDLETQKYQLIVLSHVIEHLFEPNAVIKRIHDLLAPGGRAVLFLPNIESADAKYYKQFWFHLDAPRHVNFPTASYLRKLAAKHGFASASIRSVAAEWTWKNSKAYQLREHPSECQPSLSVRERLQFQLSRVRNVFGSFNGSELIVVLKKKGLEG